MDELKTTEDPTEPSVSHIERQALIVEEVKLSSTFIKSLVWES